MRKYSHKELNTMTMQAKKFGCGFVLLSAVQSVLAVSMAYVTKQVINSAVYGGNFIRWACVLLALALAIPVLRGIGNAFSTRVTDKAVISLRQSLLQQVQRKEMKSLEKFHSGALLSRMLTDCRTFIERYTHVLPDAAGQVVQLIGAVAVLAVLHLGLAATVLALGLVVASFGLIIRKFMKSRHAAVRKADDDVTAMLTEQLEQTEILRSTVDEKYQRKRIEKAQTVWYSARRSLRRFSVSTSTLFSLALQIGSAALIIWCAYRTGTGKTSFGDFTAMLQLVALFRSPIASLTGVQGRLASSDAALDRILEVYDLPEEKGNTLSKVTGEPVSLSFRNITFSYDEETQPVFENFSTEFDLTSWNCLSGMSGRGKTTLFRLALGLFTPQSGEIILKTTEGEWPVSSATRSFFAYVPQNPVLFSGTIRENLLLANPDATEAEMLRALEIASCDFALDLSEKLDTILGQFGTGLSVGQRQRLTIARTLLTKGKILLLDEVTSALDKQTAGMVLHALQENYPCAIYASHRLEQLEHTALVSLEERDGNV